MSVSNASSDVKLTRRLAGLLTFSVGVLAANLYYAQPLTALMAADLGIKPQSSGLVVTLIQIGYGLGVLFLVPLGDLLENRRTILIMIAIATLAQTGIGFSSHLALYGAAAVALGIGTSAIQIIVPYATHLSPPEIRGRVIGSLMSGLMFGIMLSRPIAGIVTDLFSWNAVFYISAAAMAVVTALLILFLPRRDPGDPGLSYAGLIASMGTLVVNYPVLRRRGIYQACMFAAFCVFWTASPLLLAGPKFHLSQTAIAIFALVGVSGAVFAPIVGRLADRGFTYRATAFSFAAGAVSFLIPHVIPLGSTASLILMVISAILLDAGVSGNLVLGQRSIFSLEPELRGRLNSMYIAITFIGGAFGSYIGAWAYVHGGWALTSWIGFALPFSGLIYFLTECVPLSQLVSSKFLRHPGQNT